MKKLLSVFFLYWIPVLAYAIGVPKTEILTNTKDVRVDEEFPMTVRVIVPDYAETHWDTDKCLWTEWMTDAQNVTIEKWSCKRLMSATMAPSSNLVEDYSLELTISGVKISSLVSFKVSFKNEIQQNPIWTDSVTFGVDAEPPK